MCDGRDDEFDCDCGIENIVTIDTDRHGKHTRRRTRNLGGVQGALFKGLSLPGSYPQIAGAAPLREHQNAACGEASGLPLGEPTTLCSPRDESVIVGYTL